MKRFILLPIAASVLLGAQGICAEYEKDTKNLKTTPGLASEKEASDIIGKKVTNAQDEDLGKVQDLIINTENATAPYAIIGFGGVLGANRTKIAVPLSSLQCSADGKSLMLSASKEQLQAAAKTPTGAWATVAKADWSRKVDAYYGEPTTREVRVGVRDDLQTPTRDTETRTFVRDPVPKGAELLMTPQDAALCEKICQNVDEVVHIRVQNGVTHLYGQVDNEEARRNLEAKIRTVPGVSSVQSHLRVRNP
jgi:sporulation protein YlmC with PRC-barrel domain